MEPHELFSKAQDTLKPESRCVWLSFCYGVMEHRMTPEDLEVMEKEMYRWPSEE